ncbi:MAG: SH3 domain-containing protein [Gammaproteobacteria bacterium]
MSGRICAAVQSGRRLFVIAAFFAALAFSALTASEVIAEECAEGMTTRRAAVLYDGPSASAGERLILEAHYPLRRIGFVSGWCKVLLPGGENGWVRAKLVRRLRAAMAHSGGAIARADPGDSAPGVFYAKSGVVMEVLGRARPGWFQVLHLDGETGYVAAGEVWVNF